eukprot:3190092-Rhodomonas_salina.4
MPGTETARRWEWTWRARISLRVMRGTDLAYHHAMRGTDPAYHHALPGTDLSYHPTRVRY